LKRPGPWWQAFVQVASPRKIYVSPSTDACTAHDELEAFAAKIGSALGLGKSFHLKRLAFEVYDFSQDAIRLKELAGTPDEFADLFGPFWDKDASLGGGDLWALTKPLRAMSETFSKLPVLQLLNLSKNKSVGLHQYRFTGGPPKKQVAFHVRMAGLLHLLRQEWEKSSELAGRNAGINMGAADLEEDSDEARLHRGDYQLVITSLSDLLLLFTPDVSAARALTAENLACARSSLLLPFWTTRRAVLFSEYLIMHTCADAKCQTVLKIFLPILKGRKRPKDSGSAFVEIIARFFVKRLTRANFERSFATLNLIEIVKRNLYHLILKRWWMPDVLST
jgi:hypothetical protein